MFKSNRIIALLVCLVITLIPSICSAHEIYYNGSAPNWNPIPLEWYWISNNKADVKCSNDYLSGTPSSYYSSALGKWNSACSNDVYLYDASFDTSKADFCTPTTNWWDNEFPSPWNLFYLGIVWSYDTTGTRIMDAYDAEDSTGLIRTAAIFMNPHSDVWSGESSTYIRGVLVHELGHVLCLGHPDQEYYYTSASSIMKSVAQELDTPQQHDINDISAKY